MPLILCDSGPLVALIDQDDASHPQCKAVLPLLSPPLITSWACLTEAMYLVGRRSGFRAQSLLWDLVQTQLVRIHMHSDTEITRMRDLMRQYEDTPMDL